MQLVIFLKGLNVGGYRRFRPTAFAEQLRRSHSTGHVVSDVVSIGAAGTFVVRGPVSRPSLRAEVGRLLPFHAPVMICSDRDLLELTHDSPFAAHPARRDVVRFVSVMAKRSRRPSALPSKIPNDGRWVVRVLGQRGPFVWGLHRREMKAIGHLGWLEKLAGTPLATRSWSTIMSVAKVLEA